MDYSVIQIVFIFLITFLVAIDQFSFLESLYQPIVTGAAIGLVLGDLQTGLVVGGTYQLMTIGNMPIGGAQPPNAVIGGIMDSVLAISANLEPSLAVVTAIPFALIGQYVITLIGKNQDMTILIEKEDFYASNKTTNTTDYCRQQLKQRG